MPHILSVNVCASRTYGAWTGDEGATGIDKRAVEHRVRVFDDHVEGDTVVDHKHHGGTHKAVYAYAREDAEWWEQVIGRPITFGAFGENLTTAGVNLNNLPIGQRLRVGNALLEVSEPRIPCRVFSGFWDRPQLVKEFTDAARPGAYLRIIEAGDIGAGDTIELLAAPTHAVTLAMTFKAKTGSRVPAANLLPALDHFSPEWQLWISRMSESQN